MKYCKETGRSFILQLLIFVLGTWSELPAAQHPVIIARGTKSSLQGGQQLVSSCVMCGMQQCIGLTHPEALFSALFLCLFKSKVEKCQDSLPF